MYSNRIISQYKRTCEMALALKSKHQAFRAFHFSCLYRGKRLISASFNQAKTHALAYRLGYPIATSSQSIHSELSTILKGGLDCYRGHSLFVVRADNNNCINFSMPCKFCTAMLSRLELDAVYYSGYGGFIEKLEFT